MKINLEFRRLELALILFATAAGLHASVSADWERHYHVDPKDESFANTLLDSSGNVYAIGVSKGADKDALVVKYGVGGGLHWAIKFTGSGDQIGRFLTFSADKAHLYVAFDRPHGVTIARLNPSSGSVDWMRPLDLSTDTYESSLAGLIAQPAASQDYIYTPFRVWSAFNALATYTIRGGGSVHGGIYQDMGALTRRALGLAPRPQGGAYLLVGEDPALAPPAAEIWSLNAAGQITANIAVPYATCIASTEANGGQLYAVGGRDGDKVSLTRIDTATDTVAKSTDNLLSGPTDVDVLSVVADPMGAVYVAGSEHVEPFNGEWFLARYTYPNLNRTWRTSRPMFTSDDSFPNVAADAYGSVAVNSFSDGTLRTVGTQIYDGVTGTKLGEHTLSSASSDLSIRGLDMNSQGRVAACGVFPGSGHVNGLLWLMSQDGLRSVSTPLNTYVGGTYVTGTVTMYGATAGNRSVALSSNSAYATVPISVAVLSGSVSHPFTIATKRTSVDRTIVITAGFGGIARTRTFYLLAPRPSLLTLTPGIVVGGFPSQGQVRLTGLAPVGGVSVALSSNKAQVIVPASITVLEGQGAANFTASTTSVTTSVVATVAASAHGSTKTRTLTVNP